MQILVLGGSGRTGKLIVEEALNRKHTVTVLVRKPETITLQAGLTIVEGSPLELCDIEQALTSTTSLPSAVIVALGSRRASDSPFASSISPPRLMVDSTSNVVTAMRKFDTKRLVSLSAFGVGESNANLLWPMRMVMNHANINVGVRDHGMVEEFMKGEGKQGVQWTGVKSVMLTNKGKSIVRVFGETGQGVEMMPSISRASVASWLVDCAEDGKEWIGKTPVISN